MNATYLTRQVEPDPCSRSRTKSSPTTYVEEPYSWSKTKYHSIRFVMSKTKSKEFWESRAYTSIKYNSDHDNRSISRMRHRRRPAHYSISETRGDIVSRIKYRIIS